MADPRETVAFRSSGGRSQGHKLIIQQEASEEGCHLKICNDPVRVPVTDVPTDTQLYIV